MKDVIHIYDFSEDVALVERKDSFCYITREGKILDTGKKIVSGSDFKNGYAIVNCDDGVFAMDKNCNLTELKEYGDEISDVSCGVMKCIRYVKDNGAAYLEDIAEVFYINTKGEVIYRAYKSNSKLKALKYYEVDDLFSDCIEDVITDNYNKKVVNCFNGFVVRIEEISNCN